MKIALLIITLLIVSVIVAYTILRNPHDFSEAECPSCHVDSVNNPREMAAPLTELCRPCHKKITKRSSHKVDMVPELVKVPEDLPLTDGMVTCNTCHNIHEHRYTARGEKTYFLRRPAPGMEFCMSCHEVELENNRHIEIVAAAHIGSRYKITDKNQPLDNMSMECISCHDGNLGRTVTYKVVGKGIWSHNDNSHPIGVNYNESRMRKGDLISRPNIDKRIRFFNGRIGCGTCHDMYSKIPGQLVMGNEGSRLCLSCHEK